MRFEQIGEGFAMIQTRIIPVPTATQQEMLIEITENVCKPYCVGSNLPAATVEFSTGVSRIINGSAIVPVTAKVTIVTPYTKECGCATTQVLTEQFDIAFEATGTNTVTLVPGASVIVDPAYVKCCKARGVKVVTTLTATIA